MGSLIQKAMALAASTALAGGQALPADPMLRISCGEQFCKATPSIEGGQRVLYLEASSQARDVQAERILADALAESKDYFLRYGRIDLDHATVWQAIRETKLDPNNPYAKEIGRPLSVKVNDSKSDPRIYVKAAIFRSGDPANEFTKASNWFWNTLETEPPVIWYPSVAGSLLGARHEAGADGSRVRVITKLRWHSIGLTRTPVNNDVGPVSTVPLEIFCKAFREGADISSALAAMGGHDAPAPSDPDAALRRAGISTPSTQIGSVAPGILTPERAALIQQSILQAQPPFDLGTWLQELLAAGISPQEGMAFLLAVLDQSSLSCS